MDCDHVRVSAIVLEHDLFQQPKLFTMQSTGSSLSYLIQSSSVIRLRLTCLSTQSQISTFTGHLPTDRGLQLKRWIL